MDQQNISKDANVDLKTRICHVDFYLYYTTNQGLFHL